MSGAMPRPTFPLFGRTIGLFLAVALLAGMELLPARGQLNPDAVIERNEDVVRSVANVATQLYRTRKAIIPDCWPSTHSCTNAFPDTFDCTAELPALEAGCGECPDKGRKVRAMRLTSA